MTTEQLTMNMEATDVDVEERRQPATWVGDEQVYSDAYGYCWGVMPGTLESVCLGTTDHVKEVLDTNTIPKNQCQDARIALEGILKNIEEEKEIVKPKSRQIRRPHSVRRSRSSRTGRRS